MLKNKKELKISFLVVEIVNFIFLVIGGFGIFIGIYKIHQLNIIHLFALVYLAVIVFLLSLILLIVHNSVYMDNRKTMFHSGSAILNLTFFNLIITIIASIFIILALIL